MKDRLRLHGHTHASVDTHVGSTRIVCNPLGYLNFDHNPNFDEKLVVRVEPALRPTACLEV